MIALAYALKGEIRSILHTMNPKLLETAAGVAVYELEPGLLAYLGGVGKVNAAMSTQLFIDRYQPDWIVNAGCAGSFADLPIGTLVLAKERLSGILTAQGVAHEVGRVATGEVFMTKGQRADWVAGTFSPMLCEMEGGAIAQVCYRNQVKFAALKSVSDRLCQDNNAEEYFNYGEAMAKLNDIVVPFARALAGQ